LLIYAKRALERRQLLIERRQQLAASSAKPAWSNSTFARH
jgi:hypothetical protein